MKRRNFFKAIAGAVGLAAGVKVAEAVPSVPVVPVEPEFDLELFKAQIRYECRRGDFVGYCTNYDATTGTAMVSMRTPRAVQAGELVVYPDWKNYPDR